MSSITQAMRHVLEKTPCDFIMVLTLFLLAFLSYSTALFRSSLMYGIDGAYYLIQVENILKTGVMKYPDPPFSFYLFSMLTLLAGNAMLAIKLCVSLFCSLAAVPSYLLVKRMTKSYVAAAISAFSITFSPGLILMSGEFLKNAMGIPFLLFFLYFLHRLLSGNDNFAVKMATMFFFLLTGLTHILDAGVALLFFFLQTLLALFSRRRGTRFLRFSLMFLATVFSIGALLYFSSKGYTIDIGKGGIFIQQFIRTLELHPIVDTRDPGGVRAFSYVFIALGLFLAYVNYKEGSWVDFSFLMVSSIVLLCLSFPIMPPQWGQRFLLMVPISWFIIIGNLVGYVEKSSARILVATILLAFFIYFQAIPAFMRIGPVISPLEYADLLSMQMFIPANGIVAMPGHWAWRYWVEYILKSDSTGSAQEGKTVYLIVERGSQPPAASRDILLYEGRVLKLYVLRPKIPR
ncbi:MAG: 6-pyruvoyl-tetrahydropterin synthase-related protein [Thermoproteota archaeon]